MKNFLKIIILGAVGGSFLLWPIFSLAQGMEDMPIMEMTKTVDKATVRLGEFLNYTIHFQNIGNWTAYDVGLQTSLAEGTSLESASFPMSRFDEDKIEFDLPDMVPGDSQTIYIKVRVSENNIDGTVLLSNTVLSYGDGRANIDPLVYAAVRSVVRIAGAETNEGGNRGAVSFAQAKEITAEVGSHALLVNLGIAFLIACFGAGLTIFVFRIR
ncbi:MAG: hypothetical protein A3I88_03155 [Candidatus Portnoybacteria bacterium RIFCSPLOWO2_12_FULL_39_9]|uniref:DUF11 domain-containing protein n=1 Tax=Candidatus Portnoybacteria bacterium RIFCSPHIGHO2_12_FULL_38_9 TaxID=1801997 RepID=A0A1G2FG59_9BACT|nr:MAG: hypothetical protein A3H00_03150 [Candidatus Portnoybacteria bacterium RBG_13_40_8]OGZ36234.1 MAG: hypothetical protein A2646_02415 [Candidatus Portnoybacteria bacterium RIFCSPHIGHO2_02_FULL_39_12]OGZ36807.1 MAG: hypothetical protein A3J64_02580 [Candidatus Portnoybacteria bacterium RIFCSPHIGHO2_12_FULL_38_9]OGZ38070.1 MAG: hypothetical protein A3F21_00505 [Candidatus Portnoybacteria bacterium RIFCSPLOWO2_01_FULL_38_39]OGZ41100.1 MAG: hypothetical protein A3I88_03155 [Candidatus Portnoy